MSGKKSVKKVSSLPSYLKPTYSSLAKRKSNGSESPSDESLELFRSYSRWSTSTFSSAIDLDQQKKNRTVHKIGPPGRRNPSVSQRRSVVKDDGNKRAKLRGDLKTRGEGTKNSFVAEKNTKRRIPRQQSDAPSTADSALSVSPTQRLRVKKQQTSAAKLETCLSTVPPKDQYSASQAPLPTQQAKTKPRKKTSRLSQKALVQAISRFGQQNKAVMDLYDIAILLNKRNKAGKTLAPPPSTGKDLENAKKPSPKPEPHSTSLKGVIEYSKKLGNWAWSEVAGSKPLVLKLLCSLLIFVSVVVAQAPFKNLTWSENITSTFAPVGDDSNSTSLLDIFETKTEKFRQVYNHQLGLIRQNLTRSNLIVKFRDAETIEEEPETNGNLLPFFQRLLERKTAKLNKIKDLKNKGHEKMAAKLENWNITGMKQRFYGTQTGVNIVEVEEGVDMESIWSTILLDQEVEFAEVDMTMSLFGSCSLASDWGYRHTRANHANDVLALLSTNRSQDAQVLVAVIDSGVDYNHPLLDGRIWINEAELGGAEGVDDDGNGYVDDTWGWNFALNTNDVRDQDGHGTHVAGIIAGTETADPDHFSGVAPNVAILPCRFTDDSDTGSVSAAIQCMEYAFEMEADIISNSWGGAGAYSLALEEAMNRASRLGRLQINAAGNSAVDNDGSREQATYPAAYDTDIIISVAAIDNEGHLTDVSNYGAGSVDIGAPGESILSTRLDGKLERMSGTSQATPYVSAAAAVLLGACRERGLQCSALDIKRAILDGAVQDSDLDGRVLSAGFLDIPNAARILGLNTTALQERSEYEMAICRGGRPAMTGLLVFVCAFIMLCIL